MAVTDCVTQSTKKTKSKNILNVSNSLESSKKSISQGRGFKKKHVESPASEDDSETELDAPPFKKPSVPEKRARNIVTSQNINGDVSDSETDIDKPLKQTSTSAKPAKVINSYHNQSTINEPESDDEQLSVSLLQVHTAKISPKKSNQGHSRGTPKLSETQGSYAGSSKQNTVVRRPNIPEMSSSESESESEMSTRVHLEKPHPQSKPESESESEPEPEMSTQVHQEKPHPQSKPESESESESESEPEPEPEMSTQVHQEKPHPQSKPESESESGSQSKIEQEPQSESESSENESEVEPQRLLSLKQEVLTPPESDPVEDNIPEQKRSSKKTASVSAGILSFEENHTPLSGPVIDIPPDSHVSVLQVPRSISAACLLGQRIRLKGGEMLGPSSAPLKIVEQSCNLPKNSMNCIMSTGHLCYGMRWIKPEAYYLLRHNHITVEKGTTKLPWGEEISPLSVEELLKMKTNPAVVKAKRKAKKRLREYSPESDLLSKSFQRITSADEDPNLLSPKKKKKKMHLTSENNGIDPESSMMGDAISERKKRKHSIDTEESMFSTKKRRKLEVDHTESENFQSVSQNYQSAHVSATLDSGTENSSFEMRKEKKKSKKKRRKDGDSLTDRFSSFSQETVMKQDVMGSDKSPSVSKPLPEDQNDKKHKKKLKSKQGTVLASIQSDESMQNIDKVKEKKKKLREEENIKCTKTLQEEGVKKKKLKHMKLDVQLHAISSGDNVEKQERVKKKKKKEKQEGNTLFTVDSEKQMKKHSKIAGAAEESGVHKSVVKKKKKHKDLGGQNVVKVKNEDIWERETSPDFLKRLFLTQRAPEDK